MKMRGVEKCTLYKRYIPVTDARSRSATISAAFKSVVLTITMTQNSHVRGEHTHR